MWTASPFSASLTPSGLFHRKPSLQLKQVDFN
jgi:hypothetical protein